MSAGWQKNEPTPIKRRCDVFVYMSDGITPAPRSLDLIALGVVYFCGATSPDYAVALGTMTNKRKPLSFTSFTFTAANATDLCTKVAHGLETGDGPINVSNSGGALPAPLAAATGYWIIKISADTFKLATSLASAYAGTAINLTTDGTGTQTLAAASTKRGIDSLFTYEATQAETDHDAAESTVLVIGTLPGDTAETRAFTTVYMASEGANVWDADSGDAGQSMGNLVRGIARTHMANFSDAGSVRTFRDLADTKNSHHGTITGSGRSGAVIDDLT
jgi:hypothetical protein